MSSHLSILGIIHTAISVFAIMAALVALMQDGKLDPKSDPGKAYVTLTILTCLTGFPIMKTGHLTGGHYLAILILVLLAVAIYAKQLRIFGKLADYAQLILMSATLFFSLIPAVIETLTRLPFGDPLAASPNDPMVQMGLKILVVLFLGGTLLQVLMMRSEKKKASAPDSRVNMG